MTTDFVIECINKHEMQRGKRPVAVAISPENCQLGCPGATIPVLQGIPVIHNEIMLPDSVWTETETFWSLSLILRLQVDWLKLVSAEPIKSIVPYTAPGVLKDTVDAPLLI